MLSLTAPRGEHHQESEGSSLISLAKWRAGVGISDTTAWRWVKAGHLKTINIAGRPYVRAVDLKAFETRAAAGEFAKPPRGCAAGRGGAA